MHIKQNESVGELKKTVPIDSFSFGVVNSTHLWQNILVLSCRNGISIDFLLGRGDVLCQTETTNTTREIVADHLAEPMTDTTIAMMIDTTIVMTTDMMIATTIMKTDQGEAHRDQQDQLQADQLQAHQEIHTELLHQEDQLQEVHLQDLLHQDHHLQEAETAEETVATEEAETARKRTTRRQ